MLHGTDKSPAKHNYVKYYDRYLSDFRDKEIKLFEIGVAKAKSIKMWLDYFPYGMIYGMDYIYNDLAEEHSKIFKKLGDRFVGFHGDQISTADINKVIKCAGGSFDIIIDDGSHVSSDQQMTLAILFPYITPGGYYIIEDLHSNRPLYRKTKRKRRRNIAKTMLVLESFSKSGKMTGKLFTEEVSKYLTENIDMCKTYNGKICFLRKKNGN